MLYEFVHQYRDEILKHYRAKVTTRAVSSPHRSEIDHGVSVFLYQLATTLSTGDPMLTAEICKAAALHGRNLLLQGLTVAEAIRDYEDVFSSIAEVATVLHAPINLDDFRSLNRCRDDAIASVFVEFERLGKESPGNRQARDPIVK